MQSDGFIDNDAVKWKTMVWGDGGEDNLEYRCEMFVIYLIWILIEVCMRCVKSKNEGDD